MNIIPRRGVDAVILLLELQEGADAWFIELQLQVILDKSGARRTVCIAAVVRRERQSRLIVI
jgi:hypothetical protein